MYVCEGPQKMKSSYTDQWQNMRGGVDQWGWLTSAKHRWPGIYNSWEWSARRLSRTHQPSHSQTFRGSFALVTFLRWYCSLHSGSGRNLHYIKTCCRYWKLLNLEAVFVWHKNLISEYQNENVHYYESRCRYIVYRKPIPSQNIVIWMEFKH